MCVYVQQGVCHREDKLIEKRKKSLERTTKYQ